MYLCAQTPTAVPRRTETSPAETGSALHPLGGSRYELALRGKFPPRWLSNLTGGLAGRGINVIRGDASKLSASLWQGVFELSAPPGARLEQVDFMGLTSDGVETTAESALRLDRLSVVPGRDDLLVEIEGPDSVGFLSRLLKLFAFYSLFPSEVHIDTPAGRVHDRFRLKGLGGTPPSETSRQGLEAALMKLRA